MKSFTFFLLAFSLYVAAHPQPGHTFCVPDGWEGYYSFEHTNEDRSGLAHHPQNAAISHPDWTTSDKQVGNYAASFDGSSQYLQYSDAAFMNTSFMRMSMMCWAKTYRDTGVQTLFDEGGGINGISIQLHDNILLAAVRENSVQYTLSHQIPVDTAQWFHVALSYDNGKVALFLNGIKSTDPDSLTGFGTLSEHSNSGGFGASISVDAFGNSASATVFNHFHGLLDDIAYYRGEIFDVNVIQTVMQCQEIPFVCDDRVFIAQNHPYDFYEVNDTTSPYTFSTIKDDGVFNLNSLGYREQENMIYAMVNQPLAGGNMVRMSANGKLTDLGPIAGLDNAFLSNSGDVSPEGIFYFNRAGTGYSLLHHVDLNHLPYQASSIQYADTFLITDLAFNPIDSFLYSINGNNYQVLRFNPNNGTMISFPTSPTFAGSGFGAIWFSGLGEMFAYKNDGEIYQIDIDNQIASFVSVAPSISFNDGTTCTSASPSVDIELTLDSVYFSATPLGPSDSVSYILNIENLGPSLATNLVIVDSIPDGLVLLDTSVTSISGTPLDTSLYQLSILGTSNNKFIQLSLANLSPGNANAFRFKLSFKVANKGLRDSQSCMFVQHVNQIDTDMSNDTVCLILQEMSTSIEEYHASMWRIYPNPATEQVTIQTHAWNGQAVHITLYNHLGHLVQEHTIRQELHHMSLKNLPKGVYVIQIRQAQKVETFKLAKQ